MNLISKLSLLLFLSGCLSQKFGPGVPEEQPLGSVEISFSTFSVPSPNNELPRISGFAGSAVVSVEIYTDDQCQTTLFAEGTRTEFVGNGISLPMASIQNVETDFYGKGISLDDESECTPLSSFKYDNTPPSNPIIPPEEDNLISASITESPNYSWSTSTDAGNGAVEYFVSVGTDETPSENDLLPWTSIGDFTNYSAVENFVTDTTYFFRVKAVDEAGNESAVDSVSWLITDLQLSLGVASLNPSSNSDVSNPVLSGTIPTPAGNDVDTIRIFNNPSCSSTGSTGDVTNVQIADLSRAQFLTPGSAVTVPLNQETPFYARAFDTNDVFGECVSLNLNYRHDSIDPTAPSGFENAATSSDLNQSPVFTWIAGSDSNGSGVASYSYRITDDLGATIANSTGTLSNSAVSYRVTGISLTPGEVYTFRIKTIDLAGNESAEGTASWTVSALPVENPVTITYPGTNEIIRTRTRNINGTCDPNGPDVEISAASGLADLTIPCDPDGTYLGQMTFSGDDANVNIIAQQGTSNTARAVKYDIPFKGQAGFGGARVHAIAYGLGPAAGKVYVGGEFVTYKGKPQRYIVRLNADGSVDTTFDAATSITTTNGYVYAILPLEDGGAILGGAFTEYKLTNTDATETALQRTVNRIVRVTNTGARDTDFTTNNGSISPISATNVGFTSASAAVRSLAFVSGSSGSEIYVGGTFTAYRGTTVSSNFTRLDLNTGVKNTSVTYANFDAAVMKILPHPTDNSVFVGGFFRYYGAVADANKVSRLARIDSLGALVSGFNNGASAGLDSSVTTLTVSAVKALAFDDPDSPTRLYVGGVFNNYKGMTTPSSLIALELNGNIDNNFNNGDVTPYNGTTKSSVLAIEVDASGDVYIGGDFTTVDGVTRNKIAKLNNLGAIYSTVDFKVSGGFSTTAGHSINALALNPNQSSSPTNLNNDLLVGGLFTTFNGQAYGSILRMKFNADPDNFVDTGRPPAAASIIVIKAVPNNSGEVYVGGCFTQWGTDTNLKYLVKLDINGNVDTTFKPNLNGCVYDIVFDIDNPSIMYIGGAFTTVEGAAASKVAKLNLGGVSGSLRDTTFLTNIGTGFTPVTIGTTYGAGTFVSKILQDPDAPSNLYVGGNFTAFNGSAKKSLHLISSDGTNTAFTATVFDSPAVVTSVLDLKWSVDNLIYVAGNFTAASGRNYILRMTKTGTHDSSFNPTAGGQPSAIIKTVLPLTNGDVYVGGDFTSIRGNIYNRIVLLNSNGTIDTSFAVAGSLNGLSGPVEVITGGVSSTAGRIFAGGLFATANSASANHIAYFEANGSLVTKTHSGDYFDSNTGFTATTPGIRTIEDSGDGTGRVWVGGLFTVYDGYTRNSLLRLCSDGSME